MFKVEYNDDTELYDLNSDDEVMYAGIPDHATAEKLAHGLSYGDAVPFSQDIADLAREYAIGYDYNINGVKR